MRETCGQTEGGCERENEKWHKDLSCSLGDLSHFLLAGYDVMFAMISLTMNRIKYVCLRKQETTVRCGKKRRNLQN